MSATLTIHGAIFTPYYMKDDGHYLVEANKKVINALQKDTIFPEISGLIFAFSDPEATQREQCIHFGTSYKQYEDEIEQWLQNFEAILGRLFWHKAYLQLDVEMYTSALYRYEAKNYHETVLEVDEPQPPTTWTVQGALRDFSEDLDQDKLTAGNQILADYFALNTWRSTDSSLTRVDSAEKGI